MDNKSKASCPHFEEGQRDPETASTILNCIHLLVPNGIALHSALSDCGRAGSGVRVILIPFWAEVCKGRSSDFKGHSDNSVSTQPYLFTIPCLAQSYREQTICQTEEPAPPQPSRAGPGPSGVLAATPLNHSSYATLGILQAHTLSYTQAKGWAQSALSWPHQEWNVWSGKCHPGGE